MAVKLFGKTIVGGEAQRKEAASNIMSGKYPLTNDCNLMKSTIEAAKAELAQINASRPSTVGGRRIKARNADALKVWINEMQNFLKDLTCGITYTPDGIKITPPPPPYEGSAPSTPSSSTGGAALFGFNRTAPTPTTPVSGTQPIIYTPDVVKNYEQPSIKCADGTYDVANGVNPPCATKGGVYLPSLPLPAPAPTLPSGQSTIPSAPAPVSQPLPSASLPAPVDYSTLYDTAALGTAIAQAEGSAPAPIGAPAQKDDTQKYLMYGGIAVIGVLVLNSLINRD